MKTTKSLNFFAGSILSVSICVSSFFGSSHFAHAASTMDPSKKFNMSYLFFGDYASEVANTKGELNAVSPDYFELTSDGNLKVTSKYNKTFVDQMHKEGLEVTPCLSNNWNRVIGRTGLENRSALAQEVSEQVKDLNLDGVNIDLEGLTEDDQTNLTNFIKLLKDELPDKKVSVAVAANPYNWSTGWQAEYDYKALSETSDYLMIMAYDESWAGDPTPGPVAGLPWVEKSVQYALNQGVSPDKLVLGLPFYGRLWKTDGPTSNGTNVYGSSISQRNVDGLVNHYNGTVEYDSTEHSEKATFTIQPNDPISVVDGITLTPGQYVLWYDDQKSLTEKIDLVNQYDLKGTGSWSLNHEDLSTWDYFRTVLDGNPSNGSGQVQEQSQTVTPNVTTYTVVPGDALSVIAKKYNTTVQAIQDRNGLTSDVIYIGQTLFIPTPSQPTASGSQPTKAVPTINKTVQVAKPVTKTVKVTKIISYKVKRGDSLSKLAKTYHTSVKRIKRDNKLHSNRIRIGQHLKITTTIMKKVSVKPTVHTSSDTTPKVVVSSSKSPSSSKVIRYKVVRGDCLSLIAKRYHTTVTAIKKANHLKTNGIRIGQILIIK